MLRLNSDCGSFGEDHQIGKGCLASACLNRESMLEHELSRRLKTAV
jgi:hypothetical protein